MDSRNLDETKSSMDVASLNNMVVSMRKAVKGAQIHAMNKLIRSLKDLKKKKQSVSTRGNEDEQKKLEKKEERFAKELEVIKNVKPDKVSKFALAKIESYEEICKKFPDAIENRALSRLSEHKYISDKVKKFRESHEDWKELAAFILSKNTGRRFKKTDQKRTGVQREVEQVLLESQRQLQSRDTDTQTDSDDAQTDSDDAQTQSKDAQTDRKDARTQSKDTQTDSKDALTDSESTQSDSEDETDSELTHVSDEGGRMGDMASAGKTPDTFISDETQHKKSAAKLKHENTKTLTKETVPVKKISKEAIVQKSKESAIKRLDLGEFKDGEIIITSEEVPSFLQSSSIDNTSTVKKRSKSKFFMCDSDDEARESEDEQGESALTDDDADDGADHQRELQQRNKERAREAIQSTFLGSLSSAGRRQLEKWENRKFQDFKRMREERPQQWQKKGSVAPRKPNTKKSGAGQSSVNLLRKSSVPHQREAKSKIDDKAAVSGELHPSWEASRKRKQQLSQIQPFQGKKIKFDDDD